MQNKKPIIIGSIIIFSVIVIITIIFLTTKPLSNEYIYLDSVDKATCDAKITSLEAKGWNCGSCTDSDSDGKYSLYCDPPTCRIDCTLGTYDCNGFYRFKCISSGTCDQTWSQVGIVLDKCGVECKTASDCGDGQTCESYKCVGDIIVDPCEGVTCPTTFCSGNIYNYAGSCSNGQCVYQQQTCTGSDICVEGTGCKYTPQCIVDTDCPEGNKCASGSCSSIEGWCKVNEACGEGFYCNMEKNSCEKTTEILPFIAIGGTLLLGGIVVLLVKRKK